jgi:hypothetical protein
MCVGIAVTSHFGGAFRCVTLARRCASMTEAMSMRSNVKYDRDMRTRAIADRKGLCTVDLINASKRPGKLGSRITLQSPIDAAEFKQLNRVLIKLLRRWSPAPDKQATNRQ